MTTPPRRRLPEEGSANPAWKSEFDRTPHATTLFLHGQTTVPTKGETVQHAPKLWLIRTRKSGDEWQHTLNTKTGSIAALVRVRRDREESSAKDVLHLSETPQRTLSFETS